MRCKVRYATELANGSLSTKDQAFTTAERRVRLGRGTDNDIVLKDLAVALRHANIVVRDFDIIVEADGGSIIRFDDVPAARGLLTPETVVAIGPYQLSLLPPEPGFDLVVGVRVPATVAAEAADPAVPAGALRLRGGVLGRRPLSWLLFLVVLAVGLALPVVAHWSYESRPSYLPDGRAGGEVRPTLLAGFDHLWDTGELSDPHKFLDQRCEACHAAAFTPIADQTCGACHGDVRHHFNDAAGFSAASLREAGHEPAGCTSCHAEHQGPDGAVPRQQALCAGCHEDLTTLAQGTSLKNAADFGTNHPQFRPSIVVDAQSDKVERLEIGGAEPPKESSGLRFNHLCHLGLKRDLPPAEAGAAARRCYSPDGLLLAKAFPGPDGRQPNPPDADGVTRYRLDGILEVDFPNPEQPLRAKLTCGGCHQPDAGGATMRPVDMEQHCAYCHSINFDSEQPDRELPHGEPKEVAAILEDYYAARIVQQPVVRTDATGQRQRPGAQSARAEANAAAAATPPAYQQRVAEQLERVFRNDGASACGYCHVTTARQEGDQPLYGVLPVQVQRIWEPKARFDHGSHTNLACGQCHDATASSASADVLLPPIATCRACHLGEAASAAVPSTCTMCHEYHPSRGTCPIVPGAGSVARVSDPNCPLPQQPQSAAAGSAAD